MVLIWKSGWNYNIQGYWCTLTSASRTTAPCGGAGTFLAACRTSSPAWPRSQTASGSLHRQPACPTKKTAINHSHHLHTQTIAATELRAVYSKESLPTPHCDGDSGWRIWRGRSRSGFLSDRPSMSSWQNWRPDWKKFAHKSDHQVSYVANLNEQKPERNESSHKLWTIRTNIHESWAKKFCNADLHILCKGVRYLEKATGVEIFSETVDGGLQFLPAVELVCKFVAGQESEQKDEFQKHIHLQLIKPGVTLLFINP